MADFGYDVADYCAIAPVFGTLEGFDRLVEEAHARGLRIILDFVPNHSSDQHPWFQESRASRGSAKRDWYIWRDPAPDGGPPTTGCRTSAAAPGPSTRPQASTTTTPSCASSRT
jgi:alpha-glucosidase